MLAIIGSYRRDTYLHACLSSLTRHVSGIDSVIVVDDSGDSGHRMNLTARNIPWVAVAPDNAGYAAAMSVVFKVAADHGGEHVLFVEEDFQFISDLDVEAWASQLDSHPHLAQIVAMRQPWFANEVAAGGVLEALDGPRELVDGFIEHRLFFSGNPTVLPRRTFAKPWPSGRWSENQFAAQLKQDPQIRFAITPSILVEHVGERSGHGY